MKILPLPHIRVYVKLEGALHSGYLVGQENGSSLLGFSHQMVMGWPVVGSQREKELTDLPYKKYWWFRNHQVTIPKRR